MRNSDGQVFIKGSYVTLTDSKMTREAARHKYKEQDLVFINKTLLDQALHACDDGMYGIIVSQQEKVQFFASNSNVYNIILETGSIIQIDSTWFLSKFINLVHTR